MLTLNIYINNLNVNPRVYLLNANNNNYKNLKLTNTKIIFNINIFKLLYNINRALYFSEIDIISKRSDLNPVKTS